jgi:N6-adenosine-specific RNA methylase IME4
VKYRTIVADPPWHYDGFASSPDHPFPGSRVAGQASTAAIVPVGLPYPSMTVEAIMSLPVRGLSDSPSLCFLWTTNRYLPDAFDVLMAWGFKYRQTLVWRKTGTPSPFGGTVAPNTAEFVLVGRRGGGSLIGQRLQSAVFDAPRTGHSVKPDAFLDLVEQVAPPPRLELFARRQRLGWDTWGNEALEHVGGLLAG